MIKLIGHSFILTTLLMSVAEAAAEIKTDSIIKAVTIYPNSAKVTRLSEIILTAGSNDIIIDNLPINLNVSSLRVSGESVGDVSLGSVEFLTNIKRDLIQEKERNLRQEIDDLRDERKVIEDSLSRNQSQLEYIRKMVLGSGSPKQLDKKESSGSYTSLPLEQWTQAWQTLESATAEVQKNIRSSHKSLKNIDSKINKLNRELKLVSVNQRETRSARLQIDSQEATKLTLKLTYQINGARWSPVYDADLNTTSGKIELKTLAQISQRTGEDWNSVDVTLSTLRPSADTQLPPLNTWAIDFVPEFFADHAMSDYIEDDGAAFTSIQNEVVAPMLQQKMAPAPVARTKREMHQVQSQVISTDFSAEFKVPGRISLSSGSNKRRFALSSKNYKANIHLASVPRFDPRAMILAKTKYHGETPLLSGSLALYRNGSFVGNTHLSQKQSGEEIKLSFGEDDKVKVKFLPDPDKKRKDGLLFGKKKVIERHYKVSVTNNHDKPYLISLFDTIPVASDKEIKVIKTGDKPTKNKVDDKEGVVSWERTLSPKKEVTIKYGYTVSYPEDKTIPGL